MANQNGNFVDVPGGYLYWQSHGQGPDVVLLNSGGADLRMWEGVVSSLATVARVTTFDYRDTGLSSPAAAAYSEIEDIRVVLDAVGAVSAVLVGVSDGARRALAFAHQYPERTRRVVACGGSFGEFPEPTPEEAEARTVLRSHLTHRERLLAEAGVYEAAEVDLAAWAPAMDEERRRLMTGLWVANSYFATLESYHGRELDPPVKTRFAEISTPVDVLVGGRDFEATRLWARRLADQAPHANLTVVPEADHYPMFTAPQHFAAIMREALGAPIGTA